MENQPTNEPTHPSPSVLSPDVLFIVLSRWLGLYFLASCVGSLCAELVSGFGFSATMSLGQAAVGLFLIFGSGLLQQLLCPLESLRRR